MRSSLLNPHVSAFWDLGERARAELESERWATTRGFESLRFRPSASRNTAIVIIFWPSVDAGGCISGGM